MYKRVNASDRYIFSCFRKFLLLLLYITAIINLLLIMEKCVEHNHLNNMRERAPRKDIYFNVSESDSSITTDIYYCYY